MQLKPGSLICGGKYRIEKVLGQGGFGITYLAEQTSLGRRVALKEFFMKEHCDRETSTSYVTVPSAGSRELVERFREKFIKEARQIATFENSHIVRVIDVFEDNGTAYYVMEYLDGKSLEAIVREQGSLAEADAVKYIRNIADALSEVHARNFLHLDVKPANVMLNKNGEAVLIDFGISKHYDDSGNQTSSGLMAFSDGYAPLEQYNRGGLSDFTPAIDIYALGATLFKLLTGMTPPHASVINNDGLPVLPQEISPAVRNAVETAMQPRRKDRPQSIADFLALLDKEEKAAVLPVNDSATAFVKPAADAATAIGKPSADAATAIGKSADNDATVVKQPASKETTPPPASKEVQSPAKQGESKGNGVGKWLFLLILLLAVIAGAVWYGTNGNSGAENKGSNTKGNNPSQMVETPVEGGEQTNFGDTIIAPSAIVEEAANNMTDTIKEETPVVQMCNLTIKTTPGGATIKIDGEKVGTTPLTHKVEQGKHTINITKEGYEPKTEVKEFKSDIELSYELQPKPKEVTPAASPAVQTRGYINGHEYVDLGLSVKWATCNVGASSPEDYGDYYAWGETTTKSEYTSENCTTCDKKLGDIGGKAQYDVARAKWGSSWRLPTKKECEELIANCNWKWTTQNGEKGYKVTSKKNGNSIFLPAAGWRGGTSLYNRGAYGFYWSATPYEGNAVSAYYLSFDEGGRGTGWNYRYDGHSVRPVSE